MEREALQDVVRAHELKLQALDLCLTLTLSFINKCGVDREEMDFKVQQVCGRVLISDLPNRDELAQAVQQLMGLDERNSNLRNFPLQLIKGGKDDGDE